MTQYTLFGDVKMPFSLKHYSPYLTVSQNRKGILDVDTVKGCTMGMSAYPSGGCYGECYARKVAVRYGFDFTKSVVRKFLDREHIATVIRLMNDSSAMWYRIGTAGDPCHDWSNVVVVVNALRHARKIPVIVTKHWAGLSDEQIERLRLLSAVFNTSTSALDTDAEIKHRIGQMLRLKALGVHSVLRVVTCNFGASAWGRACREKQEYLMSFMPVIDNPFRSRKLSRRVLDGDITVTRKSESFGCGGKFVSLNNPSAYLGTCGDCPDQCGVDVSVLPPQNRVQNDCQTVADL